MKIIQAIYGEEYKINIRFDDGLEGVLDLNQDLEKFKETRFFELTDIENFKKFFINDIGNLEWYNGWDYCKDDIYMKLNNVDTDNECDVIAFLERYRNAV